jgi:hypothetical protein
VQERLIDDASAAAKVGPTTDTRRESQPMYPWQEEEPARPARFIERAIAGLSHVPELSQTPAKFQDALLQYAERAITIGHPFDIPTIRALSSETPEAILQMATNLGPKVDPTPFVGVRPSREWSDAVRTFFGDTDRRTFDFAVDIASLDRRIAQALSDHNDRHAGVSTATRPEAERILVTATGGREETVGLGKWLDREGFWDIVQDRQELSPPRGGRSQMALRSESLASRAVVGLDDLDPRELRVVISREPHLIAECSTGQRWRNCFSSGNDRFDEVPRHIELGSLIAYLVDADDIEVRFPYARQFLVERGGFSRRPFFVDEDFGLKGVTGSAVTRERFRSIVRGVAESFSIGSVGAFSVTNRVYLGETEAQVVRESWARYEIDEEVEKTLVAALRADALTLDEYVSTEEAERDAPRWRQIRSSVETIVPPLVAAVEQLKSACGAPWAREVLVALWNATFGFSGSDMFFLERADRAASIKAAARRLIAEKPLFEEAIRSVAVVLPSSAFEGDLAVAMTLAHIEEPSWDTKTFDRWPLLESAMDVVLAKRTARVDAASECLSNASLDREVKLKATFSDWTESDALGKKVAACEETLRELKRVLPKAYGSMALAWTDFVGLARKIGAPAALRRLELWPLTIPGVAIGRIFCWRPKERDLSKIAIVAAREAIDGVWSELGDRLMSGPLASHIVSKSRALFDLITAHTSDQSEAAFLEALDRWGREHPLLVPDWRQVAAFAHPELATAMIEYDELQIEQHSAAAWKRDPATYPGWVGATKLDLKPLAWLTEIKMLRHRIETLRAQCRKAADARSIARATYNRLRRENYGALPSPDELIEAADRVARAKYPEAFRHLHFRRGDLRSFDLGSVGCELNMANPCVPSHWLRHVDQNICWFSAGQHGPCEIEDRRRHEGPSPQHILVSVEHSRIRQRLLFKFPYSFRILELSPPG